MYVIRSTYSPNEVFTVTVTPQEGWRVDLLVAQGRVASKQGVEFSDYPGAIVGTWSPNASNTDFLAVNCSSRMHNATPSNTITFAGPKVTDTKGAPVSTSWKAPPAELGALMIVATVVKVDKEEDGGSSSGKFFFLKSAKLEPAKNAAPALLGHLLLLPLAALFSLLVSI